MGLASEEAHDPHQKCQDNAHDDACHDGKVKAAVASLHYDISRKAPQPKRQPDAGQKECAHTGDDNSNNEQELSELAG